jgi:4-oxalocrotonate tautomerase
MPIIDVKILEGVLDATQQQALIAELTDAVVRVGGDGMRPMTRVLVQEIRAGLWGVGGKPLVAQPMRPPAA